jgi:hypothetical protein
MGHNRVVLLDIEAFRRCRTFWKKAFENSANRFTARK